METYHNTALIESSQSWEVVRLSHALSDDWNMIYVLNASHDWEGVHFSDRLLIDFTAPETSTYGWINGKTTQMIE